MTGLPKEWAGVAQVFQLKRTVYEDGQMRTEIVYGITSLSPQQAPAICLLQLVCHHWAKITRKSARANTSHLSPEG